MVLLQCKRNIKFWLKMYRDSVRRSSKLPLLIGSSRFPLMAQSYSKCQNGSFNSHPNLFDYYFKLSKIICCFWLSFEFKNSATTPILSFFYSIILKQNLLLKMFIFSYIIIWTLVPSLPHISVVVADSRWLVRSFKDIKSIADR